MTRDDIIDGLGKGEPLSPADLSALMTAAVANAGQIASAVIEVVEKASAGIYLLPCQQQLLLLGLQALAVAGERTACQPFLQLLRRPHDEVERLLGDGSVEFSTGVVLGLWDGDEGALFSLAADREVPGETRWAVLKVLARLVHDRRIERDRLVNLLDRFDRDRLAVDGDTAWEGWQDAVLYLGLTEFTERVEQAWSDGRLPFTEEADKREWRELVVQMAANPESDEVLVLDRVAPITDPVAGLEWMTEEQAPAPPPKVRSRTGPDPAASSRLSEQELDWLAGFLECAQVPETTMSLEELDGYFSALVAGPEVVMPSRYLPRIWGTADGEGPVYDGMEQLQYVMDLLMRYWNTIAARLSEGFPHQPYLFAGPLEERGRLWADGFLLGLDLDREAWRPMLQDQHAGAILMFITALIADEHGGEALDAETRFEIVENLPTLVRGAWAFWKSYDPLASGPVKPVRVEKIGRNEPCPCGSGRKFKKCCGAGGAVLH